MSVSLIKGGVGEIVEKKSRFIGSTCPCSTEEEALAFIAAKKKEYWDARHNCYAYIVGSQVKCSDDGEPQHTAGRPMLDILQSAGLTNVCLVVTRYFGGTLLGTGGLIRAYQAAAKAGLDASETAEETVGSLYKISLDYKDYGKITTLAQDMSLVITDTNYAGNVVVTLFCPADSCTDFLAKLSDFTLGNAEVTSEEKVSCVIGNGKLLSYNPVSK